MPKWPPLPFSLYFRHGVGSDSEDVEVKRVKKCLINLANKGLIALLYLVFALLSVYLILIDTKKSNLLAQALACFGIMLRTS